MKKTHLIIITALIISINVFAQNPTFSWAKKLGGTNNDNSEAIVTDASGNVYTTGYFNGTMDCDPGVGVSNLTSAGSTDIFISKLDAGGNFLWGKRIGGTLGDFATSIDLDGSGNCFITGYFMGTVDFDPGAAVLNLTSAGNVDAFAVKLDVSGNLVWAKIWGGTSGDYGEDIAIDASGNSYITGRFLATADFDPNAGIFNMSSFGTTEDAYINKLDPSGNFVWAKQLGGTDPSGDRAASISIDGSGNVLSTGYFYGTADFDPGAGTFNLVATGQDIYISKLTSAGNFVWAKKLSGPTNEFPNAIETDANGNVYTTGDFDNTVDFDPGAGTFTISSVGVNDIFVSKLDASGNFVWAKSFGSTGNDEGVDISIDGSGNVYTTGWFRNTADFDPGASVVNLTAVGPVDVFISKLNALGNFLWVGQIAGSPGFQAAGYGITVNASNDLLLTGIFTSTADFDTGAGTFTMTPFGNADVFISKYCQTPEQSSVINGNTSICAGSSPIYTIASIPGATSYTWGLPGGWSGAGTSNTINPTIGSTGTISVSGVNACGTGVSQTIAVTVNPLPTITVNSGSICAGQSFTMVPSGANTYTIQGGSAVVSPTATASYTVVGTSTAGCISTSPATSNVSVSPLPTIGVVTSNTLICVGQSATITASGASTYTFNPGGASTTIVVSPTVTSNYTITGTSTQGCNNSSMFTQSVSTCAGINQISNSASELNVYPNPFNNKITVSSNGTKQTVQIFNALGSLVYKTEIENEKIEIDLGKESSGIYFVKIGTEIKRIIKE